MIKMIITRGRKILLKKHICFCEQVLGVNRQCPNVACRNELGRYPLEELTDLNVIKFWIHLENQPENNFSGVRGESIGINKYKFTL